MLNRTNEIRKCMADYLKRFDVETQEGREKIMVSILADIDFNTAMLVDSYNITHGMYADPNEGIKKENTRLKSALALANSQISQLRKQNESDRGEMVSVPFSWLVKFCNHIDFAYPMTDEEREKLWKKKLNQQFGIEVKENEEVCEEVCHEEKNDNT